MIAVMRVGEDGRIKELNEAGRELFGDSQGRRCCDVVCASSRGRDEGCSTTCLSELKPGGDTRDVRGALVRDHVGRLLCSRVGKEVVITMVVDDEIPVVSVAEVLTTREAEVLTLVAKGLNSKEIAGILGVSESTVRTHVEHARAKFGAASRAEAVARAIFSGQIAA